MGLINSVKNFIGMEDEDAYYDEDEYYDDEYDNDSEYKQEGYDDE